MIKYAHIIDESIVDGVGMRVTAFLQGCPRHCKGCHNPDLLSENGGIEIGEKKFAKILLDHITPLHKGITFSGGDPLMQHDKLLKVIMIIKQTNPNIDVWVYTGYVYEDIKHLPVISLIDVLVDGPFDLNQRDLSLKFKGSSNQRIIDVMKSLQQDSVILKIL